MIWMRRDGLADSNAQATAPGDALQNRVVAVGDVLRDCSMPPSLRYSDTVRIVGWQDLVGLLASDLAPDTVCSAAVSPSIDCMDVARILHRFDFRGKYLVIAHSLPDPSLVLQEITGLFPKLDIELPLAPPQSLVVYS